MTLAPPCSVLVLRVLAIVTPTMAGDVGGGVEEAARTGETTAGADVEAAAEVVVGGAIVGEAVVGEAVVEEAVVEEDLAEGVIPRCTGRVAGAGCGVRAADAGTPTPAPA